MYDKKLIVDILKNIAWSLNQIVVRSQAIKSSEDFVKNNAGLEKLDSICMQLINTGEALKQIDKLTEEKFFVKYPGIDWKKAKGMRDVITHHYFDIDAETVFGVCKEHIPVMKKAIKQMLDDLAGSGE